MKKAISILGPTHCGKTELALEINKQFVMFVVDPVDELVDQVRSMNSGIVVPEQKLVT